MNLNKDLTVFFVVGGDQDHYDAMNNCIDSIKQNGLDPNFLILEFGDKLTTDGKTTVLNYTDVIDFNAGKKVGHIMWKHKYVVAQHVNTKYGLYVDTDTAMANNNLQEIIESVGDGIGVVPHFWVPKVSDFANNVVPKDSDGRAFWSVMYQHDLTGSEDFITGGMFVFRNNDTNQKLFQDILKYHDDLQVSMGHDKDNPEYLKGVTDELFLVVGLEKYDGHVERLNGAANHCVMGESFMPLKLENDQLYGKNPQDEDYKPITFMHCDIKRRDPSECYTGRVKEIIRQKFNMDTVGVSS